MAQILHPGQHGIERAEMGSGVIGDDPRQGGFADSWRTMEDQVADPIGGNGASEQPAFGKDRSLADEFIQITRTEAVGKGCLLTSQGIAVMAEQILPSEQSVHPSNPEVMILA